MALLLLFSSAAAEGAAAYVAAARLVATSAVAVLQMLLLLGLLALVLSCCWASCWLLLLGLLAELALVSLVLLMQVVGRLGCWLLVCRAAAPLCTDSGSPRHCYLAWSRTGNRALLALLCTVALQRDTAGSHHATQLGVLRPAAHADEGEGHAPE